jgi:LysM repeat protein
MTHAMVLLLAAVLSIYSSSSYLKPAQGSIDARAANAGNGAGDVSMGRDATIIKPVSIPTLALPSRGPIFYKIKDGDTLTGIATTLGVPYREITWSNPGLRVPLKAGKVLRIPPVPGLVVTVKKGDSLASLAAAYGADPVAIVDFNRTRGPLVPGSLLVIPIDPTIGPSLSSGVPADPIKPEQFVCPIPGAKIILKFGPTSFGLEPAYDGYLHFHKGVDILAGYGVPIDAAAGGTVTAVGYEGAFGIRVEVSRDRPARSAGRQGRPGGQHRVIDWIAPPHAARAWRCAHGPDAAVRLRRLIVAYHWPAIRMAAVRASGS